MVAESLASDGVDRVLLAPTWIRTASATSLTLDSHRLVIVAKNGQWTADSQPSNRQE